MLRDLDPGCHRQILGNLHTESWAHPAMSGGKLREVQHQLRGDFR